MWNALGWRYQFEKQGFRLEQGTFLPDFYLDDRGVFFEVKGVRPSDREVGLCANLADEHGCTVFLAVDQPRHDATVYRFPPHEKCLIATLPTELQSLGATCDEIIGAIQSALSAQFEHGQTPVITRSDHQLGNLINARRNHRNINYPSARSRLPVVSFVTSTTKHD